MELRMRVQNGIEKRLNALTAAAVAMIDDTKVYRSDMKENQMQNLVSVTRETDSAEVILNFILYQVGRDDRKNNWRSGDFGVKLEKALRALKSDAGQIVVQVTGEETPELVEDVWVRLIRQYVGQLRRYFYFRSNY
jgi:hypothetical protein